MKETRKGARNRPKANNLVPKLHLRIFHGGVRKPGLGFVAAMMRKLQSPKALFISPGTYLHSSPPTIFVLPFGAGDALSVIYVAFL